jgi:OOP family OmpA-OmpF porin
MKKTLAAMSMCTALAAPALAETGGHWYGALDVGTLNMRNSSYPEPGSLTISAGYRFNRNVAAEGGITGYGDSTLVDPSGSSTARQGDLRFLAVGILPLNESFELFGKAGLGLHSVKMIGTGAYASTSEPHGTANIIVGVGGQVNFSSKFGMRLQYESLGKAKSSETDPGADISRVTVGGVLNF